MTEEEFQLYKSLCKSCQLNSKAIIVNALLLLVIVLLILFKR